MSFYIKSFLIAASLLVGSTINAQLVWTQQNSTTTIQFIDKVDFVNQNVGYTLLFPDKVLSTVNGGGTWTPTTIPGSNLNALSFVDSQTGWAIDYANASMYKTTNGGSNWQLIYSNPFFTSYAYDIHFVDANYGWATRSDYFLYTSNGGTSWDSVPSPGGADLFFVDQLRGFILNGNSLEKTVNGGTVWNASIIWSGSEYIEAFCAIDSSNLWAVGENGLIRHSLDGGNSWATKSIAVYGDLLGVRFYDESNGIAVGIGGLVISTADAGLSWQINNSGITTDLYQLDMVSPGQAWVTGASGVIISSFADADIQIEAYTGDTAVCQGMTANIEFDVKNHGTSPITSGNFSVIGTGGTSLDYDWNGLVDAGSSELIDVGTLFIYQNESFTVTFTGDTLSFNNTYDFDINVLGDGVTVSGPQIVCETDSVTISASGGFYYVWTDFVTPSFDSSVTFTPTESAYYSVSIQDDDGCFYYDSVYVEIDLSCGDTITVDSTVANNANIALTPNYDGKNDNLFLEGIDGTTNSVVIYNRWGDAIATFNNYDNEDNYWNCTIPNGAIAPAGTYFFTLEIPATNTSSSGWIQIMP